MKKLNGLDGCVQDFEGKPVINQFLNEKGQAESKVMLFKPTLLQMCSSHLKPGKEEVFKAMAIGHKIYAATDSVTLEDSEYKFLQNEMEATQLQIAAIVREAIYKFLDGAEQMAEAAKD